jgi:hypothetical protein
MEPKIQTEPSSKRAIEWGGREERETRWKVQLVQLT